MPVQRPMGRFQILLCVVSLVSWGTAVEASGCQHQCNCGFEWSADAAAEENTTLRYEVMGGLIGSFSPLALGGIGYLIFKKVKCGNPSTPNSGGKRSSMPWRERPWSSGGKISPSGPGPRGSTPISLYGETEDSFMTGNSSSLPQKFGQPPSVPGGSIPMSDSGRGTSQIRNVHRNFPGNDVNQWFKNVNTTKY